MYVNVSRTQNKIIRTRRDIGKKLESLEQIRDPNIKGSSSSLEEESQQMMSAQRPTFQSTNNKNRLSNGRPQEHISAQHEELVKYFADSWNKVCKELESNGGRQNGHEPTRSGNVAVGNSSNGVIYYSGSEHPSLENFVPFDLEGFWGQKFYQNLKQAT